MHSSEERRWAVLEVKKTSHLITYLLTYLTTTISLFFKMRCFPAHSWTICAVHFSSPVFGVWTLSSTAFSGSLSPRHCSGLCIHRSACLEDASCFGTVLCSNNGGFARAEQCRLKSTVSFQLVKTAHEWSCWCSEGCVLSQLIFEQPNDVIQLCFQKLCALFWCAQPFCFCDACRFLLFIRCIFPIKSTLWLPRLF